eukprot:GILI01021921.1.p2 GENE.GILI01021921.1~~GILI01021921.1.p2  ORF type:complete len:370 (-),score=139.45 GILI01021921.1:101-1210(-)
MQGRDQVQRIFNVLKGPQGKLIHADQLRPFLKELVLSHPGYAFLGPWGNFHDRYVDVVVWRILFTLDRDDDGRLSLRDLRKGNLPQILLLTDTEEEINNIRDYLSYEHFYVLYCKFFELDTDQDFFLTKDEFSKYESTSLSKRTVDRVFSEAGRRFKSSQPGKMSFEDFVYFVLCEEDKSTVRSLEYWFKLVDLDCDGVLRCTEMQWFYEEQAHRLECFNHEAVQYADVICQMNDMIMPAKEGEFRLAELIAKRPQSGTLFHCLCNLSKFIAFEQRDPFALKQELAEHPGWTEWDRWAVQEYQRLASEEERAPQETEEPFGLESGEGELEDEEMEGDGEEMEGVEAWDDDDLSVSSVSTVGSVSSILSK